MTGKALGEDAIRRDHDGASVGFCSAECATKWDAMTPEERTAKVGGK
ncbi:MAG: hypothetical protein NXI31_20190 [bacterium]|nr:hypothetical protein [bacterium]